MGAGVVLVLFFFQEIKEGAQLVKTHATNSSGGVSKALKAGAGGVRTDSKMRDRQQEREWCGEWTPRGNLGNTAYNARDTAALSSNITSCPDCTSAGSGTTSTSNVFWR